MPYLQLGNANILVRELRLIKKPCEIEALKKAEEITKAGILAMMKHSRPGMYEYQYKAEFDYVLGQFGAKGPGFPSIILAGKNRMRLKPICGTGAHHIGFDVHDAVKTPENIAPGMVFCIDVGIYHEEWGIGFRLEDNCLVTENGCENLSGIIPRTIEDIEAITN